MFNFISKRIFILPILAVIASIFILYPFLSHNFTDIYFTVKTAFLTHRLIIPASFNLKYLVLFSGLILMSLTDMLFERIHRFIPIFLMLAGVLFTYIANKPLINAFEALGIGLGIFILIDILKVGFYATGDILSAGAIGIFVGRENIVIISVLAIILGKIITHFSAKIDGVFDKSKVKRFHMAFVPVLFLATCLLFIFFRGF